MHVDRDVGFHRETECPLGAPEDGFLPVSWSLSDTGESQVKDRIFCLEFVPVRESTEGSTCETVLVFSGVLNSGVGSFYTFIPRSKFGISNSRITVLVQNLIYDRS